MIILNILNKNKNEEILNIFQFLDRNFLNSAELKSFFLNPIFSQNSV